NQIAEGHQGVLCPKCYTPQHVECWRDNGNKCAVDETPARIIERPGRGAAAGAAAGAAPAAAPTAAATSPAGAAPASVSPTAQPAAAVAPAAAPAPRPAGRAPAGPVVREAPGLQVMATVRANLERALGDLSPEFGVAIDEVT